jgi:glyoxylase-like metal-dependent hydrolase (beta-lactamase superfamily II)
MILNKYFLFPIILSSFISCQVFHKSSINLNKIAWIHGTKNCKENTDPPIQIVKFNYNTFILRQNKGINYEAPFLFLFLGNKKALLMDTGATEDENQFPLYLTVKNLISQWEKSINSEVELIVAHTHAHNDHTAGDIQFKNKANTIVVGLNVEDVKSFFKIENWPFENSKIDLGKRVIEIIPLPGHQNASIAVYDYQTKVLLSGDSFYPGRLYIQDWQAFKLSTQRLTGFTNKQTVSYILGNHIEMTKKPGIDYPRGTTYQPEEHILPLKVKDLHLLNEALKRLGGNPTYEIHDKFIIYPK